MRFMPDTQRASSRLAWTSRTYVPNPTKKTTGRSTSEKTTKASPNADAWATRARATTAPDRADRSVRERVDDAFQVRERVASRLQCSVDRIWSRTATGTAESPVARPGGASAGGGVPDMRSIDIVASRSPSAGSQPREQLLVEDTVAREDVEPVDPARTGEVREPSAGFLHQDERRGEIPRLEIDLDHRLGGALRDERIPPEIAEAAFPPDVSEQRPEAGRPAARLDVVAGPIQDLGVPRRRDPRHPDPSRSVGPGCTDRPGAATPRGIPALPERRRREGADLQLPVHLEGEERSEEGHAADVVVRPVDGVDVPAGGRPHVLLAVLLAHEAMGRIAGPDSISDEPLDGLVGLGDEAAIGLRPDLHVAPEVAQGDRIGLVAGGQREGQPLGELGRAAPRAGRAEACAVRGLRIVGHARIRSPAGS